MSSISVILTTRMLEQALDAKHKHDFEISNIRIPEA